MPTPTSFLSAGLLALLTTLALAAVPERARAYSCESNLMIVLDRSCTMRDPPRETDTRTKWEMALDALDTVTTTHAEDLQFGLILFPEARDDGSMECSQIEEIPVTVGIDKGRRIRRVLSRTPVGGPCVTNIDAAIAQVRDDPAFADRATNAQRGYVLLITDGRQSRTCGSDAGDERTLANIEALYEAGYPTFVVGFGGRSDDATLNRFAVAGGVPRMDAEQRFYYASNEEELRSALLSVAGFVAADTELGPECSGVPCPDGRCLGDDQQCVSGVCIPSPSGPAGDAGAGGASTDPAPPRTDGGAEAQPGSASRPAAPPPGSSSPGCACSASESSSRPAAGGATVLLLVLVAAYRHRRRRGRRATAVERSGGGPPRRIAWPYF